MNSNPIVPAWTFPSSAMTASSAQTPSRMRFAPIPISTTIVQFRQHGTEPTPSPSPKSECRPRSASSTASPSPSPPPRERRRFAPQLVESSVRRSRRAGDDGPATKPTDRTDITPYTKHIYAPQKKKRAHGETSVQSNKARRVPHVRRESCDEETADDIFGLVARDAQRKLQEVAMSAFPNSSHRLGGAEHFYVREGSDDDSSASFPSRGRTVARGSQHRAQHRNSSVEDISWAYKEMQDHAQRLDLARVDTLDLDSMTIDSPPSDAMGLTRTARPSLSGSPLWTARSGSLPGPMGLGDAHMPLVRPDSPLPTIGESLHPSPAVTFSPSLRAVSNASQVPQASSPFRRFGPLQERDMSVERAKTLHRLRANHSPPMLGKELTFRTCPSPKQTKLEPDHPWDMETETTLEPNRDFSGQRGLWRGYCYTADRTEKLAPVGRPAMMVTPHAPHAPATPSFPVPFVLSEEPSPMDPRSRTASLSSSLATARNPQLQHGMHDLLVLQRLGERLDERLRKEKAQAELEEKIMAEFDDDFVTQVFNYLSLGYPATARQYDEELSKISRIDVEDLERHDGAIMDVLWGPQNQAVRDQAVRRDKRMHATGHILMGEEGRPNADEPCPRWKALRLYIHEWARQHPDLDAISPLAWGVRERRGSWGI